MAELTPAETAKNALAPCRKGYVMQKLNDISSSPLRFVSEDGTTIGQFYNSWDKQYHLARYVPYAVPPQTYLCGKRGNFSPSRSEGSQRKGLCCAGCVEKLKALASLDNTAIKSLGFS